VCFGAVEILGLRRAFVSLGFHPETRRPYYWIDGSPIDTDAADLPLVGRDNLSRFLRQVASIIGANARFSIDTPAANDNKRPRTDAAGTDRRIRRNDDGLVVDGREEFLRDLVWEEFHRGYRTPEELARRAWARFADGADIERPKEGERRRWSFQDALAKARQICRRQPPPQPRRPTLNSAEHLNSYREPGYWNADRKGEHQSEAVRRAMTPAALIVNRRMLDAVALASGQCSVAVSTLIEKTGLSERSVKLARRNLIEAGLWLAERGVYVPMPVRPVLADDSSAGDGERMFEGGQGGANGSTPLVRRVSIPGSPSGEQSEAA
jgi:hypothetical protein